jgi:hypothetical protein
MDVRTAFPNGHLKETVYMRQPRGFVQKGHEHLVCRLLKSLYGLKQSPRAWYERINTELQNLGMTRNNYDSNMYYIRKNGEFLILMVYVDDLFITGSCDKLILSVKEFLHNTFSMTDLGIIRRYLGVSFEHLSQGIFIHQRDYTRSILQDFGMLECRPAKVPMPEGSVIITDMLSPYINSTYYCQLVGKLIFLTVSRPDIAYAVNRVSSFMSHPQQAHLDAVLHILRYLRGTMDYGILYTHSGHSEIRGYSDADWGSCPETRRSIGAYIFTLACGPISWASKKQLTVSRSSTEVEYRALSDGAQEAVWLSRMLHELQDYPHPSIPLQHDNSEVHSNLSRPISLDLNYDNQGAMKLAKNPVFHARTKHIEIHHHFIRERVVEGEIGLQYINTNSQPADILTKPLGRIKFETHRHNLGLHSLTHLKLQSPCG